MAEIRMRRAGRDHQEVERDRSSLGPHHAFCGIDADDFRHEHGRVFLPAQNVADRPGDLGGRQSRRRHLIEQRLEAMIVLPVDQRDRRPARRLSVWAVSSPPKPAPTITTWGCCCGIGSSRHVGVDDSNAELPEVSDVPRHHLQATHTRRGSDHRILELIVGAPVHEPSAHAECRSVHRQHVPESAKLRQAMSRFPPPSPRPVPALSRFRLGVHRA